MMALDEKLQGRMNVGDAGAALSVLSAQSQLYQLYDTLEYRLPFWALNIV